MGTSHSRAVKDIQTFQDKHIENILHIAETAEKPNFTQLQLALTVLGAYKSDFLRLLIILEDRFKLEPYKFNQFAKEFSHESIQDII